MYDKTGWQKGPSKKRSVRNRRQFRFMVSLWMVLFCLLSVKPVCVRASDQCTVTFYDKAKQVTERLKVKRGTTVRLPAGASDDQYSFQGWSRTPGRSVMPEYEALETVVVKRDLSFYPVMYSRYEDDNFVNKGLQRTNTSRYAEVIFIGDSRTCRMKDYLEDHYELFYLSGRKIIMTCMSAMGMPYFWKGEEDGTWKELLKTIRQIRHTSEKTIAVVMGYGVNDVTILKCRNVSGARRMGARYVTWLKRLKKKLSPYHAKLFFVSVNPVNSAHDRKRKENQIRAFNQYVQANLPEEIPYIDTYSYLMKSGFCMSILPSIWNIQDDGLHYSAGTCFKIFRYCMKVVNQYQ